MSSDRSTEKVILGDRSARPSGAPTSFGAAWKGAGWFGLLLMLVAAADMGLVLFPVRSSDPTWEFGVVDSLFSGLPLLTIGIAAMLASGLALRKRWLIRTVGIVALVLGLVWIASYLLFLTTVPIALENAPEPVLPGVRKAIARNTVFGVLFAAGYITAGVAALRHLAASRRKATHG